MIEISETEIKAMTKEQNYIRGYKDGKSDVIDKIRAEIQEYADNKAEPTEMRAYYHCLQIIDKYTAESENKEGE